MIRTANFQIAILLVGLLSVATMHWGQGTERGAFVGIVNKASGEPATGAFVKLSHVDRGLTFLVVSQGQGRYQARNLPPGEYRIQGIGGGMQSEPVTIVVLAAGREQSVDLSLNNRQPDVPGPATAADFAAMLPDGDGRALVLAKCTTCHNLERIVENRVDRSDWQGIIEAMKGYMSAIPGGAPVTETETATMASYLAKTFGPDVPPYSDPESVRSSHLPRTFLEGDAAKYMVVEYALSHGADPHDVAADSQGIAWVSERSVGMIGRFDPQTLSYTRTPLPPARTNRFNLNAIEVDGKDTVWAIDAPSRRLLQFDPRTREFNSFVVPEPPYGSGGFNTIRFHPDGSVWGTQIGSNQILRLDPVTRKFAVYPVPAGVAAQESARPYGMAIDGNDTIWFAMNSFGKIGKVNPQTGQITELDLPVQSSDVRRMHTDTEGNVWLGVHGDGKLAKIDYLTGEGTLYSPPTPNSGPYSVSVDRERNLIWFSELFADKLGRFDPSTETFTEFALPTLHSDVRRIEVDRSRPNRVWFSGSGSSYDKVGYLEVLE